MPQPATSPAKPDPSTSRAETSRAETSRAETLALATQAVQISTHPIRTPEIGCLTLPCALLWTRLLRFDPTDPSWPDQDRIIISSRKLTGLLNAMNTLSGQQSSPRNAHLDMTLAPPGQGLATAVGMALSERRLSRRFGHSLVEHRVWAFGCENDLETGVALEAAALAGTMQLDRLCAVIAMQDSGHNAHLARFAASGWTIRRIDSSRPDAVQAAFTAAQRSGKPCLIACFEVTPTPPASHDPVLTSLWATIASRGHTARRAWHRRLLRHRQRAEFERMLAGTLPPLWHEDWDRLWINTQTLPSTLRAGAHGLALLTALLPELNCLWLSGSDAPWLETGALSQALACGTQDHGMAALLNGIALHGGLIPCGVISALSIDRLRPALRLAALLERRVIHILCDEGATLDGEDAAWLPVEQLASLRAMPNVHLFRPCCPNETRAALTAALARHTGPTVIAVDESPCAVNATPALRDCTLGAYVLEPESYRRDVTLIASGRDVATAQTLRQTLRTSGIDAALVSLPCWKLFAAQPAAYQQQVLGTAPRIGIESASGFGWERWTGTNGLFLGPEDLIPRRIDAMTTRIREFLARTP